MELEITVYDNGVETYGGDHEDLLHDVFGPIFHEIVLPTRYEIELKECLDGTRVFVCMENGKYIRFPNAILNHVISYSNGETRRLVGDKLPLSADKRLWVLLEEWN